MHEETRYNRWFVGCACDRKYVEPTAVMLTSLSLNGEIPEATIVVAAFDLTEQDIHVLRAGAGQLASRMRIIEVTREMLHEVDNAGYTDVYPVAVLGRLFIPNAIQVAGARLLTLDSDMIVNSSVRPLFQLDIGEEYFGAVHDLPQWNNRNYFNSGMTLINVDGYLHYDVGRRCLQWLSAQLEHPRWPDQDALNTIVGDSWYRLDRRWNFTNYHDHNSGGLSYTTASIAHFTANPKPWDRQDHVGRPLYDTYLGHLRVRQGEAVHAPQARPRDLIPTCYEVFLGRQLESKAVIDQRDHWSARDIIKSIVQSSEFACNAVRWVFEDVRPSPHIFQDQPSIRQKLWAADQLELEAEAKVAVEDVDTWMALLSLLLCDENFKKAYGLEHLPRVQEAIGAAAE